MTPEEKAKLDRALALAEENNVILKGIRRSNRIATGMRIAYWVIILALTYGAFVAIQPYVGFMADLFKQTGGMQGVQNIQSLIAPR